VLVVIARRCTAHRGFCVTAGRAAQECCQPSHRTLAGTQALSNRNHRTWGFENTRASLFGRKGGKTTLALFSNGGVLPGVATAAASSTVYTHGNTNLPEVALTFDDGPSPYTPLVLAALKQYNVSATFFLWGQHVQQYPAYAQQELATGHALGDHTWSHPDLTTLPISSIMTELTEAQNAIRQATGYTPTMFRPPYGSYNSNVLATASQVGLSSTIIWSYAPRDWEMPGASVIASRVLSNISHGSIILLHDGGGDRSQTVAALPTIIQGLQARGLRLVTVPQLLADIGK
jgi:peptidoglycan/xylan/chitin deacetylase (PgdA/CDA1 family)